jgi:hypothetical protein
MVNSTGCERKQSWFVLNPLKASFNDTHPSIAATFRLQLIPIVLVLFCFYIFTVFGKRWHQILVESKHNLKNISEMWYNYLDRAADYVLESVNEW